MTERPNFEAGLRFLRGELEEATDQMLINNLKDKIVAEVNKRDIWDLTARVEKLEKLAHTRDGMTG